MSERYVVINGSINGKELTVSTKKNPERKLQTEPHTVIGQEKIKRMPVTEASRMAVY